MIGGGAIGGGTTEVLKDVGSNVLGKVGKKLVEDGADMALDLTQTATENGGLTGKDVLFSAVTSFGGDLVGAAKTNSTARNQLIDGATDNRAIKDAVGDSLLIIKQLKMLSLIVLRIIKLLRMLLKIVPLRQQMLD